MTHIVNIIKLSDQGDQLSIKYTHEFMFEGTARKWIDSFNLVNNSDDPDDRWIAVYAGMNTGAIE